ncbi:MAG: molybdenum cofactor guanylyltransferase [Chamaesiphon sp.]|nr:molybdenum cofactor guanylyltransferase [Chamaesiphon sp.]
MAASKLAIIILAGGRSARMGRDKATIEIAGVPLIRRIYDVVATCVDRGQIYVVTPWPEQYRQFLPDSCNFILEQPPDRGPLMAFSQALAKINANWLLLLACDLPNLSTPAIQTWIDSLPSIDPQSIAYLPRHVSKGWEPLCGFYRQICRESAIEYIDNGGRSFQGWLKMQVVTELVVADPLCLVNCNTPADLAAIIPNI